MRMGGGERMSERGAGALFIAHECQRRKLIEMVFMNTKKETFPNVQKGNEEILKSKKNLSLPHSSVRLTWKKPFQ